MQEYRVALETLPGVAAALNIERLHTELENVATGFANTTLVAVDDETETAIITIWLDALTAYVALGSSINLATRALNNCGILIPAMGFQKTETELTDYIAASNDWPVHETDPIRRNIAPEEAK